MLAIVIPYFKLAFFEETVQSLDNQTDRRFKVYIGDDASSENPTFLLEKYHGKFDFVYHRFEENLGGTSLVKQWERCIALTGKEEWIMILGDDDVLGDNLVEAFYENLEEIKSISNVVRFATCKIDEKGEETSLVYVHPKIEKSTDFFFRGSRSSLSEYVFSKEKVKIIGFKDFPLGWFSDVLAILEFSNFKEIYTINGAVVNIRISALSISGSQNNLELKSKSTFTFFNYLLSKKSGCFTRLEKLILLKKMNNSYLNDKKKINWFFKISNIYFINFFFIDYYHFIKAMFISYLKNNFKKHPNNLILNERELNSFDSDFCSKNSD
ncbi:glycosyltransferase [Flavobacterium sp. RSP49]|uniref:glycosyltransferase family 2 protein n=1 Tax=Flavobacterium sp. RSP49 TaxID=2497487 RepID=UPI000F81DB3E|nr:glycosyltransferase family 2 protein [Flavobacterium sp. RSP49]RTZ02918.1 glycosyltransferase [Flavobacterium sp. RSP49]